MLRRPLRRAPGLTPLVGLLAGLVAGPAALGLLRPELWAVDTNTVVLWATRLTLGFVLVAMALSMPTRLVLRQRRTAIWLLLSMLILRWAIGALAAYFLAHFTYWGAILAGAIVAPADPVLAGALLCGRDRGRRLPWLIGAESVAGSFLMVPLALLFVLMLVPPALGVAQEWILGVLLWQTIDAAALGAAAGWLLGKTLALRSAGELKLSWLSAVLAVTLIGAALAAGLNEVAVVVAGAAGFAVGSRCGSAARREETLATTQEFLTLPVFMILGATLPVAGWLELGWSGLLAALVIVLVGRLPWALALRGPLGLRRYESLSAGATGAVGVLSLYLVARVEDVASIPPLWSLVTLTVVLSMLLSAVLMTLRGRDAARRPQVETPPPPLVEGDDREQ
ncbi:MAG: cation:proton antiporter [Armatimonadota bacterium]